MRINKRLSDLGICSRREADRWIAENRITVNGEPVSLGQQVTEEDSLELDGRPVTGVSSSEKPVLLAYYKPRGIVCTSSGKDRAKNIIEAVNYPRRVYPIGRLDKDSEGLILLTNQGELANRISHAGSLHEKEYVVTVDHALNAEVLNRLADGVYLREIEQRTRPCEVWQDRTLSASVRSRQFHIVITQGLNRQIRRMCEELGYEVKKLKRIRIMGLGLSGLKPGEYREIDASMLGMEEEEQA